MRPRGVRTAQVWFGAEALRRVATGRHRPTDQNISSVPGAKGALRLGPLTAGGNGPTALLLRHGNVQQRIALVHHGHIIQPNYVAAQGRLQPHGPLPVRVGHGTVNLAFL